MVVSSARRVAPAHKSASIRLWAVGILTLGLLSGCATQQPEDPSPTTEPSLGPISTITTPDQVSRPVDAYLPSTQSLLALLNVETRKVNECLTSQSISGTYAPAADAASLAPFVAGQVSDNVARSDLWGFFSPDAADTSTYGYTRPPNIPGLLLATIPAGAGGSVQDCRGKADEGLPSNLGVLDLAAVTSLPNRGPAVPVADSRWTAAVAQWSACMKNAGFPNYQTPLDAIGDPAWIQKSSGAVSSEQIATATADMSCKVSTNLVGVGLAIQTAYDQQYISQNRDALDAYKRQIDDYLAQ